jgi:hypothetical protein
MSIAGQGLAFMDVKSWSGKAAEEAVKGLKTDKLVPPLRPRVLGA